MCVCRTKAVQILCIHIFVCYLLSQAGVSQMMTRPNNLKQKSGANIVPIQIIGFYFFARQSILRLVLLSSKIKLINAYDSRNNLSESLFRRRQKDVCRGINL